MKVHEAYDINRRILNATAKAMINKKQVPDYAMGLFRGQAMHSAVLNYMKEPIKEYSCPKCQLTIKCPREWIRAHHKLCSNRRQDPVKENESLSSRFQAYH